MMPQQKNQAIMDKMSKIIAMFKPDDFEEQRKERAAQTFKQIHKEIFSLTSPDEFMGSIREDRRMDFVEFLHNDRIASHSANDTNNMLLLRNLIKTRYASVHNEIENYHRWLNYKKSTLFDLPVDIESELNILQQMCPYDPEVNGWRLPDFELTNDNHKDPHTHVFSGIYVQLNFSNPDVEQAMKFRVDETRARFVEEYFHPHISRSGKMCMGDAAASLGAHWKNKALVALFDIICATLGTYNSESPYKNLENWFSENLYTCADCGATLFDDTVRYVGNEYACENCSVLLPNESDRIWKSEAVYSHFMNQYIRKATATKVWLDDHAQDYMENVLSNTDFQMCSGCLNFVHKDYLTKEQGLAVCCRCRTEEAPEIVEEVEAA